MLEIAESTYEEFTHDHDHPRRQNKPSSANNVGQKDGKEDPSGRYPLHDDRIGERFVSIPSSFEKTEETGFSAKVVK